jgi:hypothetical protein
MVNFFGLLAEFVPLLQDELSDHIKELNKAKLLNCDDPDVVARNLQAILSFAAIHHVTNPLAKIEDADESVRIALSMLGISEAKARKLTESKLPELKA